MRVDGAIGVGDVEAVVLGVDEPVEGKVGVAQTVGKVDPCVHDDEGEEVLEKGGYEASIEFCEEELGGCQGRGKRVGGGFYHDRWINNLGECDAGTACCLAELTCVDTEDV